MQACMFDDRALDARSRVGSAHRIDAIAHSISLDFHCSVGKMAVAISVVVGLTVT